MATACGFVYTAFVTDLFSRKIVGWQVAGHLRAGLALDALEMAIFARQDSIGDDLVHHSDRGVQYTSIRYTQRLEDIGAVRSVGSKGDSYDNAAAKAVNSCTRRSLSITRGRGKTPGRLPWQRRNGWPGTTKTGSTPPAGISRQLNTRMPG